MTNQWGVHYWGTLHTACLKGEVDAIPQFVESFARVIPCAACRSHFEQKLADTPLPDTDERAELFKWSVDIHNQVNAATGHPQMSYEDSYRRWSNYSYKFDFKIAFGIALILIIILIIKNVS